MKESETLPYQKVSQSSDDWMQQYQTETPEPITEQPTVPIQEVPKETYEAMFRHQHGVAKPVRESVDSTTIATASAVLDRQLEVTSQNLNEMPMNVHSQTTRIPVEQKKALVQTTEPTPSSKKEPIDDEWLNISFNVYDIRRH